jgi:hypothetical protein
MSAWASLPAAIRPCGITTAAFSPARAAYAAADAEVFPVEAQMTASAPSSTAFDSASVMPRSLKLPVGFMPSSFAESWIPSRSESFGSGTSGVSPSPRETIGVRAVTGSRSP